MFGIYWASKEGAEAVLCDVEDGVCYTAADQTTAQQEADKLNETAKAAGWSSRYHAAPLPEGIKAA